MALQNVEANITLDLYNHDTTPATVKAIQLDSQTRYVAAMLQNVGMQYDVDSGATVQLIVVRPDNVGVQIAGETFEYGEEGAQFLGPYAELTQVALAVSGKMRGQFKITSGNQILRTEIFAINNGVALDASTDEWADEYDGYNLEEMATSIETNTADIASLEADVSQIKEDFTDEITELKSGLSGKVDKNGEHQVTPQNIEGMQYTKTPVGGEVEGENIFTSDMLFEEGYYVNINPQTGAITHSTNSGFNTYCIPVNSNSKYNFTQARFVALAKGNTLGSEAVGSLLSNASQAETGVATYLFLSITSSTDINYIEVHELVQSDEYIYSDFILPGWLVDNLPIPTTVEKPKFATVTGNIASGGNLQLTAPKNNLRKGERIIFEGKITSFSTLTIGLTYGTSLEATQLKNYFVIDGTNISYHATNTSTAITVAHGLTLSDNIQIIWEMSAVATCKITLISDGNLFSHEFQNFVRQTIGNPFVLSDGTVLTDCKLTWTCTDLCKDIWMFGDSYFAYSEARWTYYLHQYGYDQNCLLDGFPGEGGVNGRVAFNNLLQYGTPKYAVWCLGMNDTSDSDSAPATNWVNARDFFLQYCTQNGVVPIFGTIPTVPSINHEQKNAWIRSSDYRYIDFAKAVGASANGVWFGGMLSSDNVHPTPQGARALFSRVLLDLPEIMVDA